MQTEIFAIETLKYRMGINIEWKFLALKLTIDFYSGNYEMKILNETHLELNQTIVLFCTFVQSKVNWLKFGLYISKSIDASPVPNELYLKPSARLRFWDLTAEVRNLG